MPNYRDFLAYAEGFLASALEENKAGTDATAKKSTLASIMFSWIAVESFINNMMDDFAALPADTLSLPERALLTERTLEFADHGEQAGRFVISNRPEYRRLEEKILFLVAKFGTGTPLDKGGPLWQRFEAAKAKRDRITHPRRALERDVTARDARDTLEVAQAVITMVSQQVWKKPVDF